MGDIWSAVATAFELGRPLGEPAWIARGAMGEVWQLDTDRGRWAVKKLFSWDDDTTGPARPLDVDFQLAARDAGIVLPEPRLVGRDAVVVLAGERFRVYEWVDVVELTRPIPLNVTAEAGRILGVLHTLAIDRGAAEVDSWYTTPPDPDRWRQLTARADAANAWWAPSLTEASPLLFELAGRVVDGPQHDLGVCHTDLDASNVFTRGDGALVVLDWENACSLSRTHEFGSALETWCAISDGPLAAAAAAFVDGYRAGGASLPECSPAMFTMTISTTLNFIAVMADQALTDPTHRAFAEDRLRGLLRPGGLAAYRQRMDALLDLLDRLTRRAAGT